MANTKISGLPSAASLTGVELLPAVQSGSTTQVTVNQVKTYVNTTPAITGGSINSTPIGATTPSTGAFTTLTASDSITGNTAVNNAVIANSNYAAPASLGLITLKRGGVLKGYVGISPSESGAALFDNAGVIRAEVSPTGLAVTGNISSTARTLVGTTTDDGVNALQVNGTIAVGKGRIAPVTATTGITTTPTSIYTVGSSYCSVLKVFITDSATHSALDVIAVGSGGVTVTVMTSANLVGVSPARVYTIASNIVKVSIASTTCNARVIADEFI